MTSLTSLINIYFCTPVTNFWHLNQIPHQEKLFVKVVLFKLHDSLQYFKDFILENASKISVSIGQTRNIFYRQLEVDQSFLDLPKTSSSVIS